MRFSTRIRKRFTPGSATMLGGSCVPTGSTSSARGRQGWENGQSSSIYSPGRMKRQCDTPGNSSGLTKSGRRSRRSRMLDTATLSEKSRIECSPPQATVPLSTRHISQATTQTTCLESLQKIPLYPRHNARLESNAQSREDVFLSNYHSTNRPANTGTFGRSTRVGPWAPPEKSPIFDLKTVWPATPRRSGGFWTICSEKHRRS